MNIVIYSKKYGERNVYFDEDDYDKIKNHCWRLLKQPLKEYAITNVLGLDGKIRTLRMHTLILGEKQGLEIDHINGDGLNNMKYNLRHCTHNQNILNKKTGSKNTTGYKGVFKIKTQYENSKMYWAYISVNGKRIGGGMFSTAIEAANKYNELAIFYHGEYAKLNNIKY